MRWIHPISPDTDEPAEVIGAKVHGLVLLRRLGLPVPPGFVIATAAGRAYRRAGRLPDGLAEELAAALAGLAAERVSVRSGGSVSQPGMMTTVLDLEPTPARVGPAVEAVFASWDAPRARLYRDLHDIPHDLGTAATVQAMVFGDRDARSGSGVAFSRDPNTGAPGPFGEVLFGRRGDDVVSGRASTRPLAELAERESRVWDCLCEAMSRVEEHHRDACYLEFTFEAGEPWLLQVRRAGFVGAAAVRLATDLVDEGAIDRPEALRRVSPDDLRNARTPRIADDLEPLARGTGACPGVAVGRVALSADRAARMAADGPVILVRPQTSPLDMPGIAAATGLVTARGGPTSHAAIVARAMGKPAVVGVAGLAVAEGTLIAIDGTSGAVVLGRPRVVTGATSPGLDRLLAWAEEA